MVHGSGSHHHRGANGGSQRRGGGGGGSRTEASRSQPRHSAETPTPRETPRPRATPTARAAAVHSRHGSGSHPHFSSTSSSSSRPAGSHHRPSEAAPNRTQAHTGVTTREQRQATRSTPPLPTRHTKPKPTPAPAPTRHRDPQRQERRSDSARTTDNGRSHGQGSNPSPPSDLLAGLLRIATNTTTRKDSSIRRDDGISHGSGRRPGQQPPRTTATRNKKIPCNSTPDRSRTTTNATTTSTSTRSDSSSRRDDGISHGQGSHRSQQQQHPQRTATRNNQIPSHLPPGLSRSAVNSTRSSPSISRDDGISHGRGGHHQQQQQPYRNDPPARSTRRVVSTRPSHYNGFPRNERYRATPNDDPYAEGNQDGECCDCCYSCCYCLFAGLYCLLGAVFAIVCCPLRLCTLPSPTSTTPTTSTRSSHPYHSRETFTRAARIMTMTRTTAASHGWIFLLGLVSSVLLGLSLVSMSHVHDTSIYSGDVVSDNSVWTLWAGETRRVQLPPLVRSVQVTVVAPPASSLSKESAATPASPDSIGNQDVQLAVFDLSTTCPPLTGPPVTITQDWEFDLVGGGFEYDYFHLLPGSTIDVGLAQFGQSGSTYVYLLRGQETLRDIQTGRNTDPNHWESIAVAKQFVSASHPNDHLYYNVRQEDVYIVVYDNGSMTRESSLDVALDVVMSTYKLTGKSPQCDNMRWWGGYGDECQLTRRPRNNGCFLLEAFSTRSNDSRDEAIGGDPVVSVRIRAYRDWAQIWFFSTLPLALTVLVSLCFCCCGCRSGSSSDSLEIGGSDATEPLLAEPGQGDRPPPTAPHHQTVADMEGTNAGTLSPSAPPAADDTSRHDMSPVIVIPPEHVEAVVDTKA